MSLVTASLTRRNRDEKSGLLAGFFFFFKGDKLFETPPGRPSSPAGMIILTNIRKVPQGISMLITRNYCYRIIQVYIHELLEV